MGLVKLIVGHSLSERREMPTNEGGNAASQDDPDVLSENKLVKTRKLRLEEFAFLGLIGFSIIGEYVSNVSPMFSF